MYVCMYVYIYIYLFIYKYKKIAINPKRYTSIDRYRNLSFRWPNQYSLRYEIDSLDPNSTHLIIVLSKLTRYDPCKMFNI